MSIKVAKNNFTRKIKDFDTFTKKLLKNVGDFGKLIVAKGFENLPPNLPKVQQIAQSDHIGYIHVVQDDLEGYANTVTTSTTRFGENLPFGSFLGFIYFL